ncbi:hypothetical protein MIMGU_mgv1a025066mg [Erythranthe guttata]|uniref:Peptidase A1 domain-containing protein n=2 Tax=Erythranthe guttata TaxID=4155 RepID=A0A022PSA5_ERYGU|nr:hypothetical protein MIMGU_mgv1a025066mg [Erythranthe guttata]
MTKKIQIFSIFIILLFFLFLHIVTSELIGLKLKLIPKNSEKESKIAGPFKNSGDHFMVQLGIGEPNQNVYLTLDTFATPLTWTKCRKSPYVSKKSRTYKKIPHDSPICKNNSIFKPKKPDCIYNITYPNGGSTLGKTSSENFLFFTIKNTITHINNLTFGCAKESIKNSGGVLAMNKSPESLISQITAIIGGRFSYCLFSSSKSQGYLRFGNDIIKGKGQVQTTPLVHHLYYPHAYALELIDISIGNLRLKINHKDGFSSTRRNTGFVIDTSTIFSKINRAAYARIQKVFAYRFDKFKLKKKSVQKFDLCYEMVPKLKLKVEEVLVSMTFHFAGGADFRVGYEKVFLLNKDKSLFCIGIVPSDGVSVLGAMQQHNTRFTYDLNKGTVSFSPEDCVASDRNPA